MLKSIKIFYRVIHSIKMETFQITREFFLGSQQELKMVNLLKDIY